MSSPLARQGHFLSLYAGDYMLLDDFKLWEEELIKAEDKLCSADNGKREEFLKRKRDIIKKAYYNFFTQPFITEFYAFCEDNKRWLDGYALFMTLKEENSFKPWYLWEKGLAQRQEEALSSALQKYEEKVEFYRFEQYIFYKQWKEFLKDADKKEIKIVGQMPLMCCLDSADVWEHQQFFDLRFLKRALNKEKIKGDTCVSFNYKNEGLIKWMRALFARAEELFPLTCLTKVKECGKKDMLSAPKDFLYKVFQSKGGEHFILQSSCYDKILSQKSDFYCAADLLDYIIQGNISSFKESKTFLYLTNQTLERAKSLSKKDSARIGGLEKSAKTLARKLFTSGAGKVIISVQVLLYCLDGREEELAKEDFSLDSKTLCAENALKLLELTQEKTTQK